MKSISIQTAENTLSAQTGTRRWVDNVKLSIFLHASVRPIH